MIYWKPLTLEEINKFNPFTSYLLKPMRCNGWHYIAIHGSMNDINLYSSKSKSHAGEIGDDIQGYLLREYTHLSEVNFDTDPEVFFQYALKEKTKQVMGLLETNPEVFEERT